MELTYDHILKCMKEYFNVYSTCGQDPKTAQRMNDYFSRNHFCIRRTR